jgi:hypothetical protein
MISWLEPLLDPGGLIRSAQVTAKPDARNGLALLLEGRLLVYRALASEAGWPDVGTGPSPKRDLGHRFLSAVLLHFTDDERAEAEYLPVTRARESTLATAATVLLSVLYRDQGRETDAIKLLRRRLARVDDPVDELLLRIHIGLRLSERLDWRAAAEETEAALKVKGKTTNRDWLAALRIVAQQNLFQYDWRRKIFRTDPLTLPRSADHAPLVRSELLLAGGLAEYLERQFEASLADPYVRTISFQAEDATETGLRGALLRAEWLGHWEELNRTRKLLGRYLVMSRMGTRQAVSPTALELLRLGGDDKGIRAASRTIARMGPLAPLQQAAASVLPRLREQELDTASLVLIAEGADVMEADTATQAIEALVRNEAGVVGAWSEASRALARLATVAAPSAQTEVAKFVGKIFDHSDQPALLQSTFQIIDSIQWIEVAASQRSAWLTFIEKHLGSGTDRHLAATSLIEALAPVEPEAVRRIVDSWLQNAVTMEAVAIAMDAFGTIPRSLEAEAIEVVTRGVQEIQAQANQGEYGLSRIDAGTLLLALLRRRPTATREWNFFLNFVFDPRVGIGAKTRPLYVLASPTTRIPSSVRSRLKAEISELEAADVGLDGSRESFEGAKIQLTARLGALGRHDLLARLLSLASKPTALARIEAARALAASYRKIRFDSAALLALSLANDSHHDVRSAAAFTLPQLVTQPADNPLGAVIHARILTLLRDEGTGVPFGALNGLIASADRQLARSFAREAERMSRSHPSHIVRRSARQLLASLDS